MPQTVTGLRSVPPLPPPPPPPPRSAIAELLRTCVQPAVLRLRIERVERQVVTADDDARSGERQGYATKLWLTDGQLVIQALLHRKLSTLPAIEDLDTGDQVEIHKFVVKKARRKTGTGHVVFLGIESCNVIKDNGQMQPDRPTANARIDRSSTTASPANEEEAADDANHARLGSFQRSDHLRYGHAYMLDDNISPLNRATTPPTLVPQRAEPQTRSEGNLSARQSTQMQEHTGKHSRRTATKRKFAIPDDSGSDDDIAFETINVNTTSAKKRRQALHELSQHNLSSSSRPPTREASVTVPAHAAPKRDQTSDKKMAVRFDLDNLEQVGDSGEDGGRLLYSPKRLGPDEMLLSGVTRPAGHVRQVATNDVGTIIHPRGNRGLSEFGIFQLKIPSPSPFHADTWGPFHTLMSLYSPSLPSKSYVFTTLIIPTYVSSHLISRPNSPFPPKRHIKVVDVSLMPKLAASSNRTRILGKGITVSVYRNAQEFRPAIGKVALMRGVVMQRIGGAMKQSTSGPGSGEVILNVYPTKSRIQKQSQSQRQQARTKPHDAHVGHSRASAEQDDGDDLHSSHGQGQRHRNVNVDGANLVRGGQDVSGVQVKRDLVRSRSACDDDDDDDSLAGRVENAQSDPAVEVSPPWFIDHPDWLRQEGYDVDVLQTWWDGLSA